MSERKEIERIETLLNAGFHGGAWHGPSVMEAIKEVSPKLAGNKNKGVHTIAELIYHITSWRIFCVKKLNGDAEYNVATENQNWGSIGVVDEFELETLVMELSLSHDELMKTLAEKTDDLLAELVPGSEYDFYTLLHGILHHDLYHTGQISLLKKFTPKKGLSDEDDYKTKSYFSDEFDDEF